MGSECHLAPRPLAVARERWGGLGPACALLSVGPALVAAGGRAAGLPLPMPRTWSSPASFC